jgi:hypothetical protein
MSASGLQSREAAENHRLDLQVQLDDLRSQLTTPQRLNASVADVESLRAQVVELARLHTVAVDQYRVLAVSNTELEIKVATLSSSLESSQSGDRGSPVEELRQKVSVSGHARLRSPQPGKAAVSPPGSRRCAPVTPVAGASKPRAPRSAGSPGSATTAGTSGTARPSGLPDRLRRRQPGLKGGLEATPSSVCRPAARGACGSPGKASPNVPRKLPLSPGAQLRGPTATASSVLSKENEDLRTVQGRGGPNGSAYTRTQDKGKDGRRLGQDGASSGVSSADAAAGEPVSPLIATVDFGAVFVASFEEAARAAGTPHAETERGICILESWVASLSASSSPSDESVGVVGGGPGARLLLAIDSRKRIRLSETTGGSAVPVECFAAALLDVAVDQSWASWADWFGDSRGSAVRDATRRAACAMRDCLMDDAVSSEDGPEGTE